MKSSFVKLVLITVLFTGYSVSAQKNVETLKYKLKLGWFTIGSGEVTIEDNYSWNNTSCYKVGVFAETLGIGNWLGSLDDHYLSMIDKKMMKPLYNTKNVTSSKSRWEQWSNFDYDSMSVDVKVIDHKRDDPNRSWKVDLKKNTQDILSTFMFFTHQDWFAMNRGDTVMITTFYEKKLYDVGVIYMGQEIMEFNNRNVGVYRLHLVIPEHENIKKERPIIIWVTSDRHQYPLRIQTKLPFLGSGRVDLVELNGKEQN